MRHFALFLFSIAGGLTLSGIATCIFRLVAKNPKDRTAAYYTVMALAGPNLLLENSTRSFRKKKCTRLAYGFALGLALYWATMLGLAVLQIRLAF